MRKRVSLLTVALVVIAMMVPAVASAAPRAEVLWPSCDGTLYDADNPFHVVYPAEENQVFNTDGQAVIDLSGSSAGVTVFFSAANAFGFPAWEGSALIIGSPFDDVLCGNDYMGYQEIHGGRGSDRIFGETGPDMLFGEAGADVIYGGYSPNDFVDPFADTKEEIVYLMGAYIHGGSGNDTIWGSDDGYNTLIGAGGNDWIEAAGDLNFVKGGDGADTIYTGGGDGNFVNGQGDSDNIFGDTSVPMVMVLDAPKACLGNFLKGGPASDTIYADDTCGDDIEGNGGDDFLFGGDSPDMITGGPGADVITGGLSGDTLVGGDGNDELWGEAGDDLMFGGGDDDTMYANAPAAVAGDDDGDTLFGGSGEDTLYGDGMADVLFGENNPDTIFGGAGVDVIFGGTGADYLSGDAGGDFLFGDGGADDIFGGADVDTIVGGEGDDTIDGGDAGDFIYGNDGADVLTGGLGDDVIEGGLGADELNGDAGNDDLYGNELATASDLAVDSMFGGLGNDEFFGACGDKDEATEAAGEGTDATDAVAMLFGEFELETSPCWVTETQKINDPTNNTWYGTGSNSCPAGYSVYSATITGDSAGTIPPVGVVNGPYLWYPGASVASPLTFYPTLPVIGGNAVPAGREGAIAKTGSGWGTTADFWFQLTCLSQG